MGEYRIYKPLPFIIVFGVGFLLAFLTDSPTIASSTFIGLVLLWYFYFLSGVGTRIDEFYKAKHNLFSLLILAMFMNFLPFGGMIELLGILDKERDYTLNVIGIILLFVSVITLFLRKKFHIRKTADDYTNLKQERMYDDIILELDDAYKGRIIKESGKDYLDIREIDVEVVDMFKNIKPKLKNEIINIINYDTKSKEFRPYRLTLLSTEEMIDRYINKLNKPIVDSTDTDKFPRYMFQMLTGKLNELRIKYDIKAKILEFSGVFEYALIDMFILARTYKNIPMGNTLAYAQETTQSRHLYGALNSITIRSIGRYGIAFYVGYYKAIEKMNEIKIKK